VLVVAALLLGACTGSDVTVDGPQAGTSGSTGTTRGTTAAPPDTAVRKQSVDVEGHKVALSCTGDRPKTVLFVSDIGQTGADGWAKSKVPDALLEQATVCTYDRPGLGESEAATTERSIANHTKELGEIIKAADLKTPVLVAQGFGTIIARQYAKDPRATAGLVLVDPPLWGLDLQLPANASAGVKAEYDYLPQLNTDLGMYGAGALPPPPAPSVVLGVDGSLPPLPDGTEAPFTPTTTTFPLPEPDKRHEDQKQLALKSPLGKYELVEGAGSYAQYWKPEAVVAAIKNVLTGRSR
jgi:pimeloyl-ACP methyl ester carboxylesterase